MTKYLGTGAINRFLQNCASSFEHDKKATMNLSDKCNNVGIVCLIVWLFYIVKVVTYFLCIFYDLLTGHALWTSIPNVQLSIGEKHEPIRVYNPTPTKNNSVVMEILSKPKTVKKYKTETKTVIQENEENDVDTKLFIQGVLRTNKYTLKGIVLSTKERKIPDDELLQFTTLGELSSPAMKQYVSFGAEINDKLHKLMGTIPSCAYVKRKQGTCFVLNNGDYTPIIDRLNEIFNIKNVNINLTGC